MLAPMSRMRTILSRNDLSIEWSPDNAEKLLDSITTKVAEIRARITSLEQIRVAKAGDPITEMQTVQDDIVGVLVASLLVASQTGLDAALLFTVGTTAEATGTDESTAYAGMARSALYAAWGSEYAELLGLPSPRKD